jgi:nucleolar complex protein 2
VQRTGVYVPLAPVLLEIFDSSEFSCKPKGSSLKPLDWAYYIRAPAVYPKTRVYVDALAEETSYLLLEFFASQSTSIAFPELSIPVTVTLRRHIKKTRNGKMATQLKAFVERLESNAKWIEEKRANVEFTPQDREQVDAFMAGKGDENAITPLRTYLKLQRKIRDQKREMLEKSLAGDDDDDDNSAGEEEDEEMEEDEE